jgi:hypothetical protein
MSTPMTERIAADQCVGDVVGSLVLTASLAAA